ncbi:hexosyltransferase, glycosyltransferase [Haloferax mucosum ATCC BAA-1512]|uniref:Hexosyltransferase, glycosyltransferase n=1 Tax=Haloferax mucosum ATCC BAA-1512 TaxID=662479 RepID=M0ILZ4_9EURY|nr:hexosyltransferase, glycosyltransferase [Haloferax mucosum ATCC BAA-1512]
MTATTANETAQTRGETLVADSDLLVVSHQYNSFVKSQVDELSKYYNSITVLARFNKIANVANHLPIKRLRPYCSDVKINDEDEIPENVSVIPVPLIYFPLSFSRRRLGDKHANKVARIIERRDIEFDIIHSHITWTAGHVGNKLSKRYDVPHVLTVHENREWLYDEIESNNTKLQNVWREADSLIRVNQADIPKLNEFTEHVEYIPNGFEVGRFEYVPTSEARSQLGIDDDETVLFSLGNLSERKGFQHTIEILDRLPEDCRYVIGGTGPMESKLRQKAKGNGVAEAVDLLGYVANEDLKYWMSAADVVVHPSYSESFGLVPLEALACGTPVVATRNGGSEEIIVSDDYGRLFDSPEQYTQFTEAVQSVISQDWDSDALVGYAENFTIPKICGEVVDLHQSLIRD